MKAIFLDIETTGLDPGRHKCVDIAFKIVQVETDEVLTSYASIVRQPKELWEMHDPMSVRVNGFNWELIQLGKEPDLVSIEIKKAFTDQKIKRGEAVFVCQNPSFDRGFFNHLVPVDEQERMNWPYHWLDLASMFWMMRVLKARENKGTFPTEMELSKDAIAKYYGVPPEQKPHRALNGVNHLLECYMELIKSGF
ncbi:MAG: 3'-5' exonuclease [Chlamydiia bacterium]|nr:3'-5' exonuclease [Chlamydiia bacterium]